MPNDNGWPEYAKYVLKELERLNDKCEDIDIKLDNHLQHTEGRLTGIETTLKNSRWILGFLITVVLSIFGMIFITMIYG